MKTMIYYKKIKENLPAESNLQSKSFNIKKYFGMMTFKFFSSENLFHSKILNQLTEDNNANRLA